MWQVHKYHKEIIPKDNYVPKGNKERPVKKIINEDKGNSNEHWQTNYNNY